MAAAAASKASEKLLTRQRLWLGRAAIRTAIQGAAVPVLSALHVARGATSAPCARTVCTHDRSSLYKNLVPPRSIGVGALTCNAAFSVRTQFAEELRPASQRLNPSFLRRAVLFLLPRVRSPSWRTLLCSLARACWGRASGGHRVSQAGLRTRRLILAAVHAVAAEPAALCSVRRLSIRPSGSSDAPIARCFSCLASVVLMPSKRLRQGRVGVTIANVAARSTGVHGRQVAAVRARSIHVGGRSLPLNMFTAMQ